MEWYVHAPGADAPIGPLSTDLIVRGIQAGKVPPGATVCAAGSSEWYPLTRVPEFGAAVIGLAPQQPTKAPQSSGAAGVLAVVAIGLGAIAVALYSIAKPAEIVTAADMNKANPRPAATVAKEPDPEDKILDLWKSYESLPDGLQTGAEFRKVLDKVTAITMAVPEGERRQHVAAVALRAGRRNIARTFNRQSKTWGDQDEVLIPSHDPASCMVWGSQWSKGETAESLRTIGFTHVKCMGGKEWAL